MSLIYNIPRFHVHIRRSLACAAFILLLSFALCGCGGGNSSTPAPINYTGDGTSGLRGVVTGYGSTIGTTPQPIANATISAYVLPSSSTNTSSGGVSVGAKPQLGPVVAQTHTDVQGNYSLSLIAGSYTIGAASTTPPTTPDSGGGGDATVTAHQFAQLNVVINYGSP